MVVGAVVVAGCGEAAAPFGAFGVEDAQGEREGDFFLLGGAFEVEPGAGVFGSLGGAVGAGVGEACGEAFVVGAQGLDGAPEGV